MDLGENKLKVKKASVGITQVTSIEMGVNAMSMLAGTVSQDASEVSRVIQLLNMVTPEELANNEDYEGRWQHQGPPPRFFMSINFHECP